MNPARLLEHFDRISEGPDAVARLRRFILDLAVRGKLVEQDSNDEPASELFMRIQAVKASDFAGTRKQAVITKVGDSDVPFPAPLGWLWLRFGLVHDLVRGVTYTKSDVAETQVADHLPILRANNIGASLNFDDLVFVRQECIGPDQMLRRGDYLIALSSGSKNLVGKAAFVDATHPCGFGGFCGVIRLISPSLEQFVGVFLSSRLYRDAISAGSRGIGINNLKRETLNEALFPLPPLTEQNRIVAKVEELMALCDQLEAAKNEREARRDRLVAVSLNLIGTAPVAADEAATEAQSAAPLRDAARFHLDHLQRLTTRPEHIKQLRQAILSLVFQGYLTSRLDEDGLGIDLVNEIHRQWDAEESTKARPGKSKPTAKYDCEPAFLAPETWGWIRLQLLCEQIGDIDHKMPRAVTAGVPFLSAKDLKDSGELDFSDPKYISEEDFTRLSRKILPRRDDIIYSRIGARLGKARLVEVDTRFLISYSCCLIRPKHQFVDKRFLQIFLDSHLALRQAHSGVQSIGVPDLGLGEIKAYRIPMPPLSEQHRIVAKVDELMALCGQLEIQLTTTQTDSRRLLEAVLHEALTPTHMEVA